MGSNEIASGDIEQSELDTDDVDTRYVNRGGDSMTGDLDTWGTMCRMLVNWM